MGETHRLEVNGRECEVEADAGALLLDVLRNRLGLMAARFGCGAGACGSCHVLVEGHAVPACETPMWSVAGKSVVTAEGIGSAGSPHPLQSAFIAEQAMQCGYCTPGILVSAAAFLQRNPNPSAQEVREALDRNLCRCGAHNRIVRAVLRAAKEMRA